MKDEDESQRRAYPFWREGLVKNSHVNTPCRIFETIMVV